MSEQSIPLLLQEFRRDCRCGCHSCSTEYRRSGAKQALVPMGPVVLPHLAELIEATFPEGDTPAKPDDIYWDWFLFVVQLIYDIAKEHDLPALPYSRTTKFCEQDIDKWYDYCVTHGTVAATA